MVDKVAKKFRLQGKKLFLTYPKCDVSREDAFEAIQNLFCDIVFCYVAQEHHKDGDLHLHILLVLKNKVNIKNATFLDIKGFHGNYQVARNADDVLAYCKKADESPIVFGEMDKYTSDQSKIQKMRVEMNQLFKTVPLHQLLDDNKISMFSYASLTKSIKQYNNDKKKPVDRERTCLWITGRPGIGKSRWVRTTYGQDFYSKFMNKWWDNYNDEEVVLLEDIGLKDDHMSRHIQIWADRYAFNAEIKGGSCKPNYHTFIVTSNYTIREIFGQPDKNGQRDMELVHSIERRFSVKTIGLNGELEDLSE